MAEAGSFADRVKQQADIVRVVGEYVRLKKSGQNFSGLCPFHSEKTPSFAVHPVKQIYHCFGCGAGGDVFKFVMEMEKTTFPDSVRAVAESADMPFVNHRWLGGLLTNFQTINQRIRRLHDLERFEAEGQLALLPTRERMSAQADLEKLRANLGGVKNMQRVPDAMFVIDLKTEEIAVKEARRLRIPIMGLVDTNCDPDGIDFVIPGNDDAIRSCALITQAIGQVVAEGYSVFRAEEERARQEAEEKARLEAEARARREAEEQAKREAEEQAAQEAATEQRPAGEVVAGAPAATTLVASPPCKMRRRVGPGPQLHPACVIMAILPVLAGQIAELHARLAEICLTSSATSGNRRPSPTSATAGASPAA